MKGYVVGDIEVRDPDLYAEYARQVPATIDRYGGRYLVRGGDARPLEGGWSPHRVIVLEFDSVEQARAWYESEEYQELAAIRQRAAVGSLLLVAGV
jgi:uncharacterized protein (DUF1330 family)